MTGGATARRLAHLAVSLGLRDAGDAASTATTRAVVAALVARLPGDRRRALGLGLAVVNWASWLRHGRPFHRLDAPRIGRLLDDLGRSRWALLRRLERVLTMLGRFAAFQDEATFDSVGYDGPWIGTRDIPVHPPPRLEEPPC